jgi:hypothetical protein
LLHRRRLASEHVRLSDPAMIENEHEALDHVVHMHGGEPDLTQRHVPQLSSLGEAQLLAELRLVARPVHRPRLSDDNRRPAFNPFDRHLVSGVLRLVVHRDEAVIERPLVGLVDDAALGVPEDVDGRDVDDSPHPGRSGSVEHTLRPADVHVPHPQCLGRRDPDPVLRGQVNRRVAALETSTDRLFVRKVALDELAAELPERSGPGRRAHERHDHVPTLPKRRCEAAADKAGAPGQKDPHRTRETSPGARHGDMASRHLRAR